MNDHRVASALQGLHLVSVESVAVVKGHKLCYALWVFAFHVYKFHQRVYALALSLVGNERFELLGHLLRRCYRPVEMRPLAAFAKQHRPFGIVCLKQRAHEAVYHVSAFQQLF